MVLAIDVKNRNSAGINLLRLIGKDAVSAWTPISTDLLTNQAIPIDKTIDIEIGKALAVYGRISGQQKASLRFRGEKGKTI